VPLALGSFVALPVFILFIPVVVFRLLNEEKILRRDLPGYSEYCRRTRYRLVSFIWGGFKFVVRQLGRASPPDISVPTQAPSSCGVRVCIETEMSYSMQTVADQMHVLSHYKVELKW
jgi:hypothetical protein